MRKPDLDQMWETFIKIPIEDNTISLNNIYDTIRSKIYPMISRLRDDGMLDWYCFLIHNRNSGVPTSEDDDDPYCHIRIALKKDLRPKDFRESLPNYCVMTRKIEHEWVESISGIDKSLLKNDEIEEAWRIIGEQSEWVIEMLNIHKKDVEISPHQIGQFLHFYSNMTCVAVSG